MNEWEIGQDEALIEAGAYMARCLSVEDDVGQFGAQIKLTFQISDAGNYEGEEIAMWVSAPKRGIITPRMNLYKVADALIGPLESGKGINRVQMIGQSCKILIAEMTREDGSGSFSKITGYSRLKTNVKEPAAPTREAPVSKTGSASPLESLQTLFGQIALTAENLDAVMDGLGLDAFLAFTPDGDPCLDFSKGKPGLTVTIKAINALKELRAL